MEFKVMVLSSVCLLATSALAQTPSNESLQKLEQVLEMNKQFDDMVKQMPETMKAALQQEFNQYPRQDLSPAQREQLEAFAIKVATESSVKLLNDKDIRQQATAFWFDAAKQHLTQEEVDAMIQFYSTPIGKSVWQKQTPMTMDYMQKLLPVMSEKNREILKQNAALWQAEYKRIVGKTKVKPKPKPKPKSTK